MIQRQKRKQKQEQSISLSGCFLVIVITLGIILAVAALHTNTNPGGSNSSFDKHAEAYSLAQPAQDYREHHPQAVNYGLASITLFYDNAPSRRFVPTDQRGFIQPFRGYTDRVLGNLTHSEFFARKWILATLGVLKRTGIINTHVTEINIIIFSQVVICPPCVTAMVSWQREFRDADGISNLFLSIWQIIGGKGYSPAKLPQGKPVHPNDIEEVPISFNASFFPSHVFSEYIQQLD